MKKPALAFLFLALFPGAGWAQSTDSAVLFAGAAPVDTIAKEAFLIDANTGTPLYAKSADEKMPTSSMSKMMTIYLVFEAIKQGKLTMDDLLPVSERAWREGQGGSSTMFLNIGQKVRVEDLIRGVVIQSGNDASMVLAEALGSGSPETFAEMMNAKARELGMINSHFTNPSGLPDPDHYSTARDLAILALALLHDFPEYYHYFSELSFTYNGHTQGNRNPLLYHPEMRVDGIKTGHTEAGGMGLTASALRDGRRLVLVVNGIPDSGKLDGRQDREDESSRLLDWGYREFGLYLIAKAGQNFGPVKVWLGTAPAAPLVAPGDVLLTLPRSARPGLKATVVTIQPIAAPVARGQVIGKLNISAPGLPDKEFPLVAGADVPRAGLFERLWMKLKFLLKKA